METDYRIKGLEDICWNLNCIVQKLSYYQGCTICGIFGDESDCKNGELSHELRGLVLNLGKIASDLDDLADHICTPSNKHDHERDHQTACHRGAHAADHDET